MRYKRLCVINAEKLKKLKNQFINVINQETRYTSAYTGKSTLDKRVMQAMADVPRHKFVPSSQISFAYDNMPLTIGSGQTISQPFIVALMTDFLATEENHIVLDVGTGSGYQAAILSRLVKKVISVEIVESLAISARQRLRDLGYENVSVNASNGFYGCQEYAPYDGIIVAAASPVIPQSLINQLKVGGKMVIPVGNPYNTQELVLVKKTGTNEYTTRYFLPVAFVPLVGLSKAHDE